MNSIEFRVGLLTLQSVIWQKTDHSAVYASSPLMVEFDNRSFMALINAIHIETIDD